MIGKIKIYRFLYRFYKIKLIFYIYTSFIVKGIELNRKENLIFPNSDHNYIMSKFKR